MWQGEAYLSAISASEDRIDTAQEVQDQWTGVIDKLSVAAEELHWARDYGLTTKGDAEGAGFNVADDGTVTPGTEDDEELLQHHQNRINNALNEIDSSDRTQSDAIRQSAETLGRIAGTGGPSFISLPGRKEVDPDTLIGEWSNMRPKDISRQIEQLSESDRNLLLASNPKLVGNTDGVPWSMRFQANALNIRSALIAEENSDQHDQSKINMFQSMLAMSDDPTTTVRPVNFGQRPQSPQNDLVERKFLLFDPDQGQGRTIELLGDISPETDNVGVLVPGTGAEMSTADNYRDRAKDMMAGTSGRTAMLVWQDADFPDTVAKDAPFAHYAKDAAPQLTGFSQELGRNVTENSGDPAITYVAHSYGGAILGTADASGGFYADREVFVETAGAGVGVASEEDWNNLNPDVQRFSMTAPGDYIDIPQNAGDVGLGGGGLSPLGGDPDDFSNVTRLDTGYTEEGDIIAGPSSHSDVFEQRTDSMKNISRVIDGGEVTLYNPRTIEGPHINYNPSSDGNLLNSIDLAITDSALSFLDKKMGNEPSPSDYSVVNEEETRTMNLGN